MNDDILAQIEDLEQRIQTVLEGTGAPTHPTSRRFRRSVVQAILDVLDAYELADLASLPEDALSEIIAEALQLVIEETVTGLRKLIATNVTQLVGYTETFYQQFDDLDLPSVRVAVARSQRVAQLTAAFDTGMAKISADVRRTTTETVSEQIARGAVNREELQATLITQADQHDRVARTQARAAVGAYNQTYRNELAVRADLKHFHYYGFVQRNTRAFCRIHINRIFSQTQIDQMRNSMQEPVETFRGGWNCTHTWLPVNLEWSPALRDRLCTVEEPTDLALNANGTRIITVFAEPDRIERLRAQIKLARSGYEQFIDADGEDRTASQSGFAAIHSTYFDAIQDRRTKAYKRLTRLRQRALELASDGHRVELRLDTNFDLLVDGEPRTFPSL